MTKARIRKISGGGGHMPKSKVIPMPSIFDPDPQDPTPKRRMIYNTTIRCKCGGQAQRTYPDNLSFPKLKFQCNSCAKVTYGKNISSPKHIITTDDPLIKQWLDAIADQKAKQPHPPPPKGAPSSTIRKGIIPANIAAIWDKSAGHHSAAARTDTPVEENKNGVICECGSHATYGYNGIEARHHSTYCPVYKEFMRPKTIGERQ